MQLVPYYRYTVRSIVGALLLAQQLIDEERGHPLRQAAQKFIDAAVTPFLFRRWLTMVILGLRRGHAVLKILGKLASPRSANDVRGQLNEIAFYLTAIAGRDPPSLSSIDQLISGFTARAQRFLLGTPSQAR